MTTTELKYDTCVASNYHAEVHRLADSLTDQLRSEVLLRDDVADGLRVQLVIDVVAQALENLLSEEICGEPVTLPRKWWDGDHEESLRYLEKEITDHVAK